MTGGLGWVNVINVMGLVGLGLNISGLGWVKENRPAANSAAAHYTAAQSRHCTRTSSHRLRPSPAWKRPPGRPRKSWLYNKFWRIWTGEIGSSEHRRALWRSMPPLIIKRNNEWVKNEWTEYSVLLGTTQSYDQLWEINPCRFFKFIYLLSLAGSKPMNRHREKYNVKK